MRNFVIHIEFAIESVSSALIAVWFKVPACCLLPPPGFKSRQGLVRKKLPVA